VKYPLVQRSLLMFDSFTCKAIEVLNHFIVT